MGRLPVYFAVLTYLLITLQMFYHSYTLVSLLQKVESLRAKCCSYCGLVKTLNPTLLSIHSVQETALVSL